MAKPKKTANTVSISLAGAEVESEQGSVAEWDYNAALALLEGQDGARLQINRIEPKDFRGYCGELTPSEFSAETVRDRFGPGIYRVQGVAPDENGRLVYIKGGGRITIAPTPGQRASVTAAAASNGTTDISALMLQMEERRRSEDAQRTDRMLRYAAVLGPIIGPILAKMVGGNSMTELITAVSKLKELSGTSEGGDRLDTFLKALEYARENETGGAKPAGSTWLDLARDVVGDLKPAAMALLSNKGATAATATPMGYVPSNARALPAATPDSAHTTATSADGPSSVPDSSSNASDPMLQYLPWLRGTLQQLVVQAARSKNPALYAEVVLDNLPSGLTMEALIGILQREDWWKLLCQFHEPVTPYQGWFTQFRDECLAYLNREDGTAS